ncbi:TraB family protein [bacterium (Candidatus Blackallbacteria) CG17_big_fil_post_rev_8_21_14_2_50_48_46]|uniref:TraB family protein n=1 Tax=bacterium (Candidatus Blackallbacteria) CG17_big_fil_post_rev_8_21_14_2_50_48_46 TaxID=2014261 RepID=A0A2M7G2N0_9BACT|nr:MAG: conjugal transfer protein TraB [bacterium (Candidatus Blackallbacteria) CG18_big_fil_WC_8_21_14_2_50_49_26]PIW16050.1 MAG: TraB family protein [bacterium (Candidatus Blackallbacteria) CG17_big_fil_post_rev_8_21_14_2_50_48_46]PIW50462.1 MAG: TraB family protein [bacterium (Candidatus Blackallbacteria) CG13_big_fil_rev_8_21_14_2_50_49_14]
MSEQALEHENILRINQGNKQVILIGTAHISRESAKLVQEVIAHEQPDTVCVELCPSRLQSLRDQEAWKNMDIVKVIREKKTFVLFLNFLLTSIQRRMARNMDVKPGLEMLAALESAEALGAQTEVIDRDVRTTLTRVWRLMGFFTRLKIFNQILASLFEEEEEISAEEVEALKQKGALELLLDEMGQVLPGVKKHLIDERDLYMVEKIRQAPGQKLVAVVGAGHVPGMIRNWENPAIDLDELDQIPPAGWVSQTLQWFIPALVIVLLIAGFFVGGKQGVTWEKGLQGILGWTVVTGGLAGIGALLARAHPLTILASIASAPITTLHPLIGVGYVAGLVEAWLKKPRVKDFESLHEDIQSFKGWQQNQVTRILLVVILSSLGASLGTFIGYGWLIDNLFRH